MKHNKTFTQDEPNSQLSESSPARRNPNRTVIHSSNKGMFDSPRKSSQRSESPSQSPKSKRISQLKSDLSNSSPETIRKMQEVAAQYLAGDSKSADKKASALRRDLINLQSGLNESFRKHSE